MCCCGWVSIKHYRFLKGIVVLKFSCATFPCFKILSILELAQLESSINVIRSNKGSLVSQLELMVFSLE